MDIGMEGSKFHLNKFSRVIELIKSQYRGIRSLLILKDGKLIVEEYFSPYDGNYKHVVNSCTKSVISGLVGIAINDGHIGGVNEKVFDYFEGMEIENDDDRKRNLRIEHLLTMTTGFRFNEPDIYPKYKINKSRLKWALDTPMEIEPGIRFKYCNCAIHILSAIIQKTTGMTTLEFAMEKLFNPLGIEDIFWEHDSEGISLGSHGIYLRPNDMVKLGLLYLKKGRWNENQVIPESWIDIATSKKIDTKGSWSGEHGYGYLWWMNSFGGYSARGKGGQYIFVIPEYESVVVFTSSLSGREFLLPEKIVNDYILPLI